MMLGNGSIYGKFLSEEPASDELVLSVEADAPCSRKCTLTDDGQELSSCIIRLGDGPGIGDRVPCIHGIRVPRDRQGIPARDLLLCKVGNLLLSEGHGKVLVQTPHDDPTLEDSGFCRVGAPPLSIDNLDAPRRPLATRLRSAFRSALPGIASALYRMRPKECHYSIQSGAVAGRKARVLFAGYMNTTLLHSPPMFDGPAPETMGSGRIREEELPLLISRVAPDILVRTEPKGGPAPGADSLLMPTFVRALVPVDRDIDGYLATLGDSTRRIIEKLGQEGHRSQTSNDPLDALLFFKLMHLPMISKRHGDYGIMSDWEDVREGFLGGRLLMVGRRNAPVAASLLVDHGKRLYMKYLGIARGDFNLTRAGANYAVVWHSIKYAFENGYDCMDLGHAAPFHSDGILSFKKKWRPRLVRGSDRENVLRITFSERKLMDEFVKKKGPITLEEVTEAFSG